MKSQKTLSALNDELDIAVADALEEIVIIQVTGTFTATLQLQGTVNKTDYVALRVENLNDGTTATDITAPGLYRVSLAGLDDARVRVTAHTSGSAAVAIATVK